MLMTSIMCTATATAAYNDDDDDVHRLNTAQRAFNCHNQIAFC